ncbi:MAG: hypothetical protein ACREQ9_09220, partial [Candidatus Binatia bacterium]
ALNDALHHELELARALGSSDDTHLSLLLLSGALELRRAPSAAGADADLDELARLIGLPADVSGLIEQPKTGTEAVVKALKVLDPLAADGSRHRRLADIGERQLALWREYRRHLVREAVRAEVKAVDEIRFSLEFDLSQALAGKKENERKVLEGS